MAGDPTQFGAQTALLVRVFSSQHKFESARTVGEEGARLLNDFCALAIDRNRNPRQSTLTLTSQGSIYGQQQECSTEHVVALVEVTFALVDALLTEIAYNEHSPHFDPRGPYMSICDRLSRVQAAVGRVCGSVSDLSARVLTRRASAGWAAMQCLMRFPSAPEPFDPALQQCIGAQERAVEVLRILTSYGPPQDALYCPPDHPYK